VFSDSGLEACPGDGVGDVERQRPTSNYVWGTERTVSTVT